MNSSQRRSQLRRIWSMAVCVLMIAGPGLIMPAATAQGWAYYRLDPEDQRVGHSAGDNDSDIASIFWEAAPRFRDESGDCIPISNLLASGSAPSLESSDLARLKKDLDLAVERADLLGLRPLSKTRIGNGNTHNLFCKSKPSTQPSLAPRLIETLSTSVTQNGADMLLGLTGKYLEIENDTARQVAMAHAMIKLRLSDFMIEEFVLSDKLDQLLGVGMGSDDFDRLDEGVSWAAREGWSGALAFRLVMADTKLPSLAAAGASIDDPDERFLFAPGRFDRPIYLNTQNIDPSYTAGAFWFYTLGRQVLEPEEVYDALDAVLLSENTMKTVDDFLDLHDGDLFKGFEHLFPEFLAYYAALPETRFDGAVSQDRWLEESFGGCKTLKVDDRAIYARSEISLAPYSAACFEIEIASTGRSWTGMPTLRAAGEPDVIDNVVMSLSKYDGFVRSTTCRDLVLDGKNCLLVPQQGEHADRDFASRFVSTGEVELENDNQIKMLIIVAYVPSEHQPYEMVSPPGADVAMTLSLDLTGAEEGWFNTDALANAYGSKQGGRLPGPPASRQVSRPDASVMEGDATAIDPALQRSAVSFAEHSITITDEEGNSLDFRPKQDGVLARPVEGTYDSIVTLTTADDRVGLADPDKSSTLMIELAEEEGLSFRGIANVCLFDPMDFLDANLQGREPAPCIDGERRRIEVFGAIPFPEIWTASGALQPMRTENYKNLREVRTARIAARGGAWFDAAFGDAPSGPGASDTVRGPARGTAAEEPAQCTVLTASNSCDCSCESLKCMEDLDAVGMLPRRATACRLTCGKKWKACSP